MYWLNLKSVAFPVPQIIGGTRKKLDSQSINQSIKTFARAPVTDDNWRRTSNPIKSIDKIRITN